MQSLKVGPGESGVADFIAKARQQPILGGDTLHKFTTHIQSSGKEGLTVGGEVISRAMIPVWVLPVVLVLCLGIIALAAFILGRDLNQSGDATETAVAEMQTSTAVIGQLLSATQTSAFNMTQAAAVGELDDDGDGLTNSQEAQLGTNPNNPDTDGDLLNDSEEVHRATNPLDPDTDRDSRKDGDEVRMGTDPLNPDTDGDGIIDGLDLDPLDRNNPSLTATAIAGLPTATPVTPTPPPTARPTDTPPAPPTATSTQTQIPVPVRGIIAFESNRQGNSGIFCLQLGRF